MRIVSLESSLENLFWQHVNKDVPHHYFFASGWKYNRDDTNILLALEDGNIEGMLLIYKQSIVQLRGAPKL
jgi:hypothetical protein